MKKLIALTLFQLKDKLDFSWAKKPKTLIQKIVFGIIKFLLVGGITFALLYVLSPSLIGLFDKYSCFVPIYTVFFSILFIMSLLSTTIDLTKSLYFADDNKTLVTLPATTDQLFFSKIFVYLLFELKKSLNILVPGTLGFMIFGLLTSYSSAEISFWSILWFLVPIIVSVFIQVLLGAILSIPALYIYKFYKQYPIVGLITLIIAVIGAVVLVVFLINLIPENIDLVNQWYTVRSSFSGFVITIDKYIYPLNLFTRILFGEPTSVGSIHYVLRGLTFVKFAIAIGVVGLLTLIAYFAIKPFYFRFISKTFEFEKNMLASPKKNIVHKKYVTFVNKEVKLSFRDIEISGTYIAVYIIVPILLLLMNKIVGAITTSMRGNSIILAINFLLSALPLLASNSMIATLYSKEGRVAYIKKTNPVDPLIPLISKLIFNLFLSVPCVMACAVILALLTNANWGDAIMFAFAVLFVQYAHIFFCATQDIMNPQNEAYATSGNEFNNPNELRATIVAFVGSFALAIVAFLLFSESLTRHNNYDIGFLKILIIAIASLGSALLLFVLKIKAFYYEK